ncbi:pyridoxal-phosphate dependent enzyme, partial [Listeria monocytogenes]|uniref:pyridoxal-phosphate dependent enzyme n=1 Tax=Listeria monocytogenes TaxID=1639 RepID=UPI001C8EC9FB
ELAETEAVTLVNSVNPYRLEGQKTASFEICEQLGSAPDVLAIPVGTDGNNSAYWKGFKELNEAKASGLPRMHGFEAEGAAAIV